MSDFRYKQVLIFRSDIRLSRGKTAAQAGHAAVASAEEARKKWRNWWKAWMMEGQCKIALKVRSEKELLELEKKARELKLPCALIVDRGLTEIPQGTITCLGIGPAPNEKMDKITGALTLL